MNFESAPRLVESKKVQGLNRGENSLQSSDPPLTQGNLKTLPHRLPGENCLRRSRPHRCIDFSRPDGDTHSESPAIAISAAASTARSCSCEAIAQQAPPSTTPRNASKAQPFENDRGKKFVPVAITSGANDGKRVLFSASETRRMDYEAYAKSDS